MSHSDVSRTGSPLVAPPRPRFSPQVHQSVHGIMSFVHLETRLGHVYAAKKILDRRGASMCPRRRPCSTANHLEHTLRRVARMLACHRGIDELPRLSLSWTRSALNSQKRHKNKYQQHISSDKSATQYICIELLLDCPRYCTALLGEDISTRPLRCCTPPTSLYATKPSNTCFHKYIYQSHRACML